MRIKSRILIVSLALAYAVAGEALAANYTVISASDSGPNTLRDAITQANLAGGAYSIEISAGLNISITSMLPTIRNPTGVSITGLGGGATINAGSSDRIFFIGIPTNMPAAGGGNMTSTAAALYSISNLTLTGGKAQGGTAGYGAAGGGGGAGMGGAIFLAAGTLDVDSVIFNTNQAIGGTGGVGYNVTSGTTNNNRWGGGGGGMGGNGGNSGFSSGTTVYGGAGGGGFGLAATGGSSGVNGTAGIFTGGDAAGDA